MNIKTILNEIDSAAFREIANELNSIIERIQTKEILYKQGIVEITGCKHIIQSIALDWTFNRKKINFLPKNKQK